MTKKIWTFAEVREKIQEEMDLQEETFISDQEYLDYTNEAINMAEALIHNMYQDYFLAKTTVSLVASTAEYDLPADIYANKIRHIQWKEDRTRIYEVRRVPLEKIMFIDETRSTSNFVYHLENSLSGGQKIVFHPLPLVTDSTSMEIWYIRNANRMLVDADTIDIPEFIEYIFAFLKVKIAKKEQSPLLNAYIDELDQTSNLMRQTLDQMVPDADATIEPDLSYFRDFSYHSYDFGGFS